MGIFDRLDRLTNRQVDRAFSQRVTIHPQKRSSPNGRREDDASRAPIECRGIYDTVDEPSDIEIGKSDGAGNDFRARVGGAKHELSIDSPRYPDVADVRQGDFVVLHDGSQKGKRFTVVRSTDDGYGRVVLHLAKA